METTANLLSLFSGYYHMVVTKMIQFFLKNISLCMSRKRHNNASVLILFFRFRFGKSFILFSFELGSVFCFLNMEMSVDSRFSFLSVVTSFVCIL